MFSARASTAFAAITAPACLAHRSRRRCVECDQNSSDVLIIGAGFAGAACARELRLRGLRSRILEAKGRIGGRTFSAEWQGGTVELGGHYVHHLQPFVWAEIQRYGKTVVDNGTGDDDCVYKWEEKDRWATASSEVFYGSMEGANKLWMKDAVEAVGDRPFEALDVNNEAVRRSDNVSAKDVMDALKLPPMEHAALLSFWEGTSCCSLDACSYLGLCGAVGSACSGNFNTTVDSLSRFAVEGGISSLHEDMMQDANVDAIHLFSEVANIDSHEAGVTVTTVDGEKYSAKACVVTVPINVLRSIEFNPPLSKLQQDAVQVGQGSCGFQIMLKVMPKKGSHSELKTFAAISTTPEGIQWLSTERLTEDGGQILVAYGPDAKAFNIFDKDMVQREVDRIVGAIVDPATSDNGLGASHVEVVDSFAWDWTNDPYARGTWNTYKQGWLTQYSQSMNEPHPAPAIHLTTGTSSGADSRIFFAGDYLATCWSGCVDGAIESGIAASRRVGERLTTSAKRAIPLLDGSTDEL